MASLLALLVIIGGTLYYTVLLYWYGSPDTGPVFSSYVGLALLGAAALAIGVMASSFTSNQIVAAVVGMAVLLIFSFVDRVSAILSGLVADVLSGISMNAHFLDFTRGVVDTSHVIYFVSMTAVFLFIAVRSLETRRWR